MGGWQIAPAYDPMDFSADQPRSLSYHRTDAVLTWTYEPTNLMSTLAITFAGTNYQWFMPQLQGQRLALTFDSSGMAQLWQDDTCWRNTPRAGSGTTNVVLAVTHPVGLGIPVNNVFIPNPTNSPT